ncbi:MAG: hypothetical protein GF329_09290, partial [Candidatus Lokiarchaeota archaeon]|nr:hypothetical protein [Candidatus Lokiarchaeota archaeon]
MQATHNSKRSDKSIIKELKKYLQIKIPQINEIYKDSIGYRYENNRVISLGLAECGLNEIPEEIFHLESLEDLILGNNKISEVSNNIVNLKVLKKLYLNNNNISRLPENIGKLKFITDLNLADNNINVIPESIGDLKNLKFLTLEKNNLTMLPKSIDQLESLLNYHALKGDGFVIHRKLLS